MAPKFLGGEVPDVAGKDRRRRAGEMAGLAREPLVRHVVRQSRLGALLRASASSSRSTTSGSAIPPPTPSCSKPSASTSPTPSTTSRPWSATSATRELTSERPSGTRATPSDERNFAHAKIRRIKAENLLDAISLVTETKDKFQGLPAGCPGRADRRRRQQSTYFLTTFGRATRETVCSCEVKMEPTLSQALHLLNGDTINPKIQQGGVIQKLIEDQEIPRGTDRRTLRPLLCRGADQGRDRQALPGLRRRRPNQAQALDDLFWAC